MKKFFFLALCSLPTLLNAQWGLKAGANFSNVSKAGDVNSDSQTGFIGGIFFEAPGTKTFGFRSEISYYKAGYKFSNTGSSSGDVNLDYLALAQLATFNLVKLLQVHVSFNTNFLLNATVDSTASSANPTKDPMDFLNHFDYGLGLGAEIHPIGGLLVGARFNWSFAKLFKDVTSGQQPTWVAPDAKNNVFSLYAGYKIGGFKKQKDSAPTGM
jgi:hypothetical protein